MFSVTALPALYGDSLWIEWGDESSPSVAVVDTGPPGSTDALCRRLDLLREAGRKVKLLVISHIDLDHIGGLHELVESERVSLDLFEEIWFNGRDQLAKPPTEKFGFKEGIALQERLATHPGWNKSFAGEVVSVDDTGALPSVTIDGLTVTILSPNPKKCEVLCREWDAAVEAEREKERSAAEEASKPRREVFGRRPSPASTTQYDRSPTNGSSIALHLQFGTNTVVLCADAHPGVLVSSLKRIAAPASGVFDLVQLPHHGSSSNVSKRFLESAPANNYLASSNGTKHDHPHVSSLDRMLDCETSRASKIWFNYPNIEHINDWFKNHTSASLVRCDGDAEHGAVIKLE
ncbi:ComEC/Rec2 family competence protein [Burkholderia sp. PU8-34]